VISTKKTRRRFKLSKDELLRRQRLGDLHKLFRDRCGRILPDSWEGRRYLKELLLPLSLWPYEARHRPGGVIGIWGPADKMRHAIKQWAPWMDEDEIQENIDEVEELQPWQRKPLGKTLGRRLNLTYEDRTRLQIKTIRACNISDRAMAIIRKQKKQLRNKRRYTKSRADFLAQNTKSKEKPWTKAGISRATWYRRINQEQARETGQSQVNLLKAKLSPVSTVELRADANAGLCVRPSTATHAGQTATCVIGLTAGSSREAA
jgi:hypothetical protein